MMNLPFFIRSFSKSLLLLLPVTICLTPDGALAQERLLQGAEAARYRYAQMVRLSPSGMPTHIVFSPAAPLTIARLPQWLSENLALPPHCEFKLIRSENDQVGYTHYRYRQTIDGIPVEDAVLYAHVKDGVISSLNGEIYNPLVQPQQPAVSEPAALAVALGYMNCENYMWQSPEAEALLKQHLKNADATYFPKGELCWMPAGPHHGSRDFHLTYRFDIYGTKPLKRYYIYIDAATGDLIAQRNRIQDADVSATAVTKYSGTRTITTDSYGGSYRLHEAGRGGGIITYNLQNGYDASFAVDFTDADNYWNNVNPQQDEVAADAHWGAEKTYDYYFTKYSRNGLDDAGGAILSYVHYDNSYSNAFWDGTGAFFGDGGTGSFSYPLVTIDIIGHEFTHGVTEFSAGLIYEAESGALNESFSDLMGKAVEFSATPSTFTWRNGPQATSNGLGIRNMSDPNEFDNPDTYEGNFWVSTTGDCSWEPDNCGVHTNSGVQNYWFYLLVTGGSGVNDNGDSYNITGIGMNDAAAIAYRNLTTYLTPSSTYADARYYSIQAASDLFGSCSNQVLQTTNAWYAVGIGSLATSLVQAGFTANKTFSCTVPTSVTFTNTSTNASVSRWDFGDGVTSTTASPSHTYSGAGVYTVTLIVTGSGSCGSGSDTLVRTSYITITNTGAPIAASCTPTTTGTCCGMGISSVSFNTISNTSSDATEGYKDFTCSASTQLTASVTYPVTVTTGTSYQEDVRIWIDYNNNGTFTSPAELVFSSDDVQTTQTGSIRIPSSATMNTPLRMRVASEYYSNTSPQPCTDVEYGQFEDYTVFVRPNTNPPVANFIANKILTCDGAVSFRDTSDNTPTSWSWRFGDGSTSSQRNPAHTYTSNGTYDVRLIVCNAYGCDTLMRTAYITVNLGSTICDTVLMPSTGNNNLATCSGNLMDTGGELNYLNSSNGTVTISPPGATTVTLTFQSFNFASSDYLYIYDGPTISSTLIAAYTGNSLPNGGTITSSGSSITLRESTSSSTNAAGFLLTWTTNAPAVLPIANFSESTATPAFGTEVEFFNLSSANSGNWRWNFGDGSTSQEQSPKHTFTSSGAVTVELAVANCFGTDTVRRTLVIHPAPVVSVWPDTLRTTLLAGDSTTLPLYIANYGGELQYNISGNSSSTRKEILALTYGADLTTEYPNTLAAINQYFTNYNVTASNSTDPVVVGGLLTGKNLVLIPEVESGTSTLYANLATVLQNFVNQGGSVIFCGSGYSSAVHLFNTGLFTGTYISSISSGTLTVSAVNHPITQNLTPPVSAQSATFYVNLTNPDVTKLVTYLGYDVVSYREVGLGKIVYMGFDFNVYNTNISRLIANAVQWASTSSLPNWLSLSTFSGTLPTNDTARVDVEFNASGLVANLYTFNLLVRTNDPSASTVTVPCLMNVIAFPIADFKADRSISCNGTVNFINQSLNNPTSYSWNFGDGGTSALANPSHVYSASGMYDVRLRACNALGCDTIIKNDIINVFLGSNLCDTVVVPNTGSTTVTTCSGNIMDSGRNNDYLNNSNGTLTISPPAATRIRLEFTSFSYASSDYLYIYDGPTTASPQIGYYTGTTLPNGGVITSTGGSITLREYTTSSGTSSGFTASWTGTGQPIPPIANFYVATMNPPLNTAVNFYDLSSSNSGNWFWTFGDGSTSTQKDPTHAFATSGSFIVKLIVSNCYGSDTTAKTIVVQQPPSIIVIPDSFHVTLLSGNSTTRPLSVINNGNGGLVYDLRGGTGVAYDSMSTKTYTSSGASTNHVFPISSNPDTVKVVVTINGDFDSGTSETASLYVEGTFIATIRDNDLYYTDVSDSFFLYGPNLSTWLADNQLNITITNSSAVDVYTGGNYHKVRVITQGTPWLSLTEVTQQLLPSHDTTVHPVLFDATQLLAGTYYSSITVTSNDALRPTVSVPCRLDVIAFPVVNFTADRTTTCDGTVTFADASVNNPTSFFWNFGDGRTSTLRNPTHAYTADGHYNVTLVGCNNIGCDTLTKNNFISVTLGSTLCDTFTIPSSGDTVITGCSGNIYDSGGSGNYFNSSTGIVTISPPAAVTVTVRFTSFNYASSDYLYIYNGPSTASPLIGSYTGTTLPNNNGIITSSGGSITLREYTSSSTNSPGFVASWTTNAPAIAPTANFSVSNANPAFNSPVTLTDLSSSNTGAWFWDFGDGGTSALRNPVHSFQNSGTYQIKLTVFNCFGSDTATRTITVKLPPHISVTPDSLLVTLNTGDSTIRTLTITNTGGDLNYHIAGGASAAGTGTIELLALTYGVDYTQEYTNALAAINQYFTNYHLIEVNTTSAATLQSALLGKHVLLIPEQETGTASVFTGFATVLQNFASQGGTVIFCATSASSNAHVFNSGLFSGSYVGYNSSATLTIVNPTHPLVAQVTTPFISTEGTYYSTLTNSNIQRVVTLSGYDIVVGSPGTELEFAL